MPNRSRKTMPTLNRIRIGLANKRQAWHLALTRWLRSRQQWNTRRVGKVCVYYRICDQGYAKNKAPYITKEHCLSNAIATFPPAEVEWHVVADNISDATYAMILKYLPEAVVQRVNVGNGAGTFRMIYEEALTQPDDTLVYFLEDDYLHLPNALPLLIEAAEAGCADFMTLYDHPDKYLSDSPNPHVVGCGEQTKVFFTGSHHWKRTNSTTMTFAAFVPTLRRSKKYFWRWTATTHPYDYHIFNQLRRCAHRHLISPIPSLSTHGDIGTVALGVDWEQV